MPHWLLEKGSPFLNTPPEYWRPSAGPSSKRFATPYRPHCSYLSHSFRHKYVTSLRRMRDTPAKDDHKSQNNFQRHCHPTRYVENDRSRKFFRYCRHNKPLRRGIPSPYNWPPRRSAHTLRRRLHRFRCLRSYIDIQDHIFRPHKEFPLKEDRCYCYQHIHKLYFL